MKYFLIFGIIAITVNTPITLAGYSDEDWGSSSFDSSGSSEKSTTYVPVKLTNVDILQCSHEYYSSDRVVEVKEVTQTYNCFSTSFTVIKDLPLDTKVVVKVYWSTSKDGYYEHINDYSFGLGDTNNKYYKYLPHAVIKYTKSAKTFIQGHYEAEDYGVFQFYKCLPKEELNYPYFKMIYNYECNGEVILSLDHRFESNYENINV